ncbi:hypothetical protein NQ117_02690 [Paenibacillus sp. SC116]|uniref:hypothetical protein n=1 Tax=Paenibacillus sp. SC116 TaxID=2968986 RepID=UPI00215AD1F9|nr:hypothetical protein [Paenibacillus sp. SC116]MCR8842578.1 hypothetical protein [Paenibacillus sp. SC116]
MKKAKLGLLSLAVALGVTGTVFTSNFTKAEAAATLSSCPSGEFVDLYKGAPFQMKPTGSKYSYILYSSDAIYVSKSGKVTARTTTGNADGQVYNDKTGECVARYYFTVKG